MKIFQIIKRVNNTELNLSGMHDSYVLVPKKVNPEIIFDKKQDEIDFTFKRDPNVKINVSYTRSREQRFNRLGDFYRNNNLKPGDEVLFERVVNGDNTEYFIDFFKHDNNLIMQKIKDKGFELLYGDLNKLTNKKFKNKTITFKKLKKEKKRKNSPVLTQFYDICLDGESQFDEFNSGMYEFRINKESIELLPINVCVVYEMDVL